MSTFAVKGVSRTEVYRKALKETGGGYSMLRYIATMFGGKRIKGKAQPKIISPFYECPQRAREFLERGVASGEFCQCVIVCRVRGLNSKGKRTSKVIGWKEGLTREDALRAAGLNP